MTPDLRPPKSKAVVKRIKKRLKEIEHLEWGDFTKDPEQFHLEHKIEYKALKRALNGGAG